jgi:hypothetical protein
VTRVLAPLIGYRLVHARVRKGATGPAGLGSKGAKGKVGDSDYVKGEDSESGEKNRPPTGARSRRPLHATPPLNRSLAPDEEHVVCPLPHMRAARIKDLAAIPELVAVLVNPARKLVIE